MKIWSMLVLFSFLFLACDTTPRKPFAHVRCVATTNLDQHGSITYWYFLEARAGYYYHKSKIREQNLGLVQWQSIRVLPLEYLVQTPIEIKMIHVPTEAIPDSINKDLDDPS